MTGVLIRRGRFGDTQAHMEEAHVMTEIEGGVAQLQAKELQGLSATTR